MDAPFPNTLGLDIRRQGRAAKDIAFELLGEVTPADIEEINNPREEVERPTLKQHRRRHHALAKSLAEGLPEGDAAIMHGYRASHVSVLKQDPSFRELVGFYEKQLDVAYLDMHERLAAVGFDAVSELERRLEDNPEDFTVGHLLEITKVGADRTGHGPTAKTEVDVRVGLSDKLTRAKEARQAALARLHGPDVVEGTATDVSED